MFVTLRTHKAFNILKRSFIAELFMEYFRTFSRHLSNIVWSSYLVALQPVDGESATPIKLIFFEYPRLRELLLVTYQCKWQNFQQRCRMQTSAFANIVPLQTLYKSDANTDALRAMLKIFGKTHKKHLRWIYLSLYSWKSQIA